MAVGKTVAPERRMATPRSKSAAIGSSRFVWLAPIEERRIVSNCHAKRANVIFANVIAELDIVWTVDIQKLSADPDHEKLSNFFFDRKFVQRLLCPLFAVAVRTDRAGLMRFG
jgi:hypothetical protein